jgi:WD40 repeat protein/energy-coupling factor transporter ATP-binding protein EcfA2
MLSTSRQQQGEQASNWSADIKPDRYNPFPGLRPFTSDESNLYFGREGQINEILVKLSVNRFICVMGYSGSGKSSLMSCGLIPVLQGGFIMHSSPNWHAILSRPGTSPIENLCDSIIQYLLENERIKREDSRAYRSILLAIIRTSSNGLVEVAQFLQEQHNDNVFFLFDQFEELFRFQDPESVEETFNEIQQYINLILTAVRQVDTPIYAAITMRSDFIAKCSPFPGLTDLINASNYLVPQMTREERKVAIRGPVEVAGGKISYRLVSRLLNDMGHDQDQLPILQHALMRTWDYWVENREEGEPLDLRHYQAIGGISQALSMHANEIYEELSTRQKEIAEVLFKSITEKTADNKGMRRPCKLSLIAEIAEADTSEVIEIVEHFRKPGRSFLMPGYTVPLSDDSVIELSHESLMRIWNKLDLWVNEEFESAAMYKRLSEAAEMYQIGKTSLWRPPDLQLAINWRQKQRPTRFWAQRYNEAFERVVVFLDTSWLVYESELRNQEVLRTRSLNRTRNTAIILGIAALIAILFFILANVQKLEADKQTLAAKEQEEIAKRESEQALIARNEAFEQRKLALEQNRLLEEAQRELKLALDEARVARDQANRSLQYALLQEKNAVKASEDERIARVDAENQKNRAETNLERANQLYMLTIAQAMAGKSVQEDDDKDLAGALAMQSYHFHRRYDGKRYDPFIYNALYHALTINSGASYNAVKVPGGMRNRMNAVAVSTSTNTFYAAGADGRIFKGNYETRTSAPVAFQNAYPNKVIALSKDEQFLINGTDSAVVQVVDLKSATAKPLSIAGMPSATNAIEVLPDNVHMVVSKADRGVYQVNIRTGQTTLLGKYAYELKALSVTPDGKSVAGVSWTGQLVVIDLETKAIEVLVENPAAQFLSVQFSPDGNILAYGTYEKNDQRGLVKLFDVKQRKEIRQYAGHKAGVYDVAFSPDGKLLASAGSDRRMQMWVLELPQDLPIQMDNNNGFIWDIEFSRDSKYLIAACHDSEIRVWSTDPELLAKNICPVIKRNMTPDEWSKYVGNDIPYETTCINLLISDY